MNNELYLPINLFVEYMDATDKRKHNILADQLKLMRVDKSFPLYGNGARAQIKKTILAGMDHSLTNAKIKEIKASKPEKKWNQTDAAYSIEILELFKKLEFPKALHGSELKILKPTIKTMPFYGITLKPRFLK